MKKEKLEKITAIEKSMKTRAADYSKIGLQKLYKIRAEKKVQLVREINAAYDISLPESLSGDIIDFLKDGNTKVGKSVKTFSLLAGCSAFTAKHIFSTGYNLELSISGTCGDYCSGCFDPDDPRKSACYVIKSYFYYPSVLYRHAINTAALRTNLDLSFDVLLLDLVCAEKRKSAYTVRWHASGEFYSLEYIAYFNSLAKCARNTFYTYTKNAAGFKNVWDVVGQAKNLSLNVSVWHDYSQKDFIDLLSAGYAVKAYVFQDADPSKYDYTPFLQAVAAVAPTTVCECPAYAANGHMDHNHPCEKCKLCFVRKNLVIFCKEH